MAAGTETCQGLFCMPGPLNDPKHEAFARHISQGKTKREAAVLAGFSEKTASSQGSQLAKRLNIAKRIEELQNAAAERAIVSTLAFNDVQVASKQDRTRVYGELYKKMLTIIEERGKSPEMQNVPGGKTGLVVRQIRSIGHGQHGKLIPEYVVDTPMIKELRATAQQAAEELGQWPKGKQLEIIDATQRPSVVIGLPDGKTIDAKPLNAEALEKIGKIIPIQ